MGRYIFFAFLMTACSGADVGPDDAALGDKGNDAAVDVATDGQADAQADGHADVAQESSAPCDTSQQNAYGVCYPTADIGTTVRSGFGQFATPGDRITNFSFTGYAATDVTPLVVPGTTKTLHLGDYFDPQQKGVQGIIGAVPIKLIHLTSASVWCGPANEEADFIAGSNYTGANTSGASFASELAPLGVVFVQVLDDGPVVNTAATISDLNTWITHHNDDYTTALDPSNANLSAFTGSTTLPFSIDIDARSMEILATSNGADASFDQTIKNTYLPFVDNPATVKQ